MAEGFFSREAGQKRRAALEQGLMHYVPPELRGWLGVASMFNPVTDMEQAGQKARIVASPDATGQERFNAGVGMVTDMATVVAPAYGASKVGAQGAAGLVDSLTGIGMPARQGMQDAGRRFAVDESGAVPLRGGGMSDPTQTGWTFRDMDRSLTKSLSGAENNRIAGDTARVEELPIRQMYATQPTVNPDFAATSSSAGELPLVVRKDGKLFVMDGHHRLTKTAEEGAQTARTRFIDLDGRETEAPLLDYRPEQNSFTAADDDLLAQLLGDQQTPSKADEIARMLREGRASDVTDDMMGALDPNDNMRLFQLYEDGATGMPMPMDTPSRMARAEGMGFDTGTPLFRGDRDLPQYGTGAPGPREGIGVTSSTSPNVAATYLPSDGTIAPLSSRASNRLELDAGGRTWTGISPDARTNRGALNDVVEPSAYLDEDNLFDFNNGVVADWGDGTTAQMAVADTNSVSRAAQGQGFDEVRFSNIKDRGGYSEWHTGPANDPHTTVMTADPRNIRSRFARFDPRLKHLANLSAGVGGAAYLGNQGEDAKAAQIRAYLEGL